jgi:hypothetical protein
MRRLAVLAAVPALLGLAASASAASSPASTDAGTRSAGRALLERHGPALATIRLTVKTRMVYEGREQTSSDSTVEVAGTVLTPDGLTALSDFTTHPETLFQRGAGGPRFETETSDVKLVLADGRELPARFVLRDNDLDLAFVAPLEPVSGLACVRLEKGATPAPLDDLLFLSQLGRSFNRAPAVTVGRVRAVVKRPRTFVVPGVVEGLLALGGPAFDVRGRPVGLVVLRRSAEGADLHGLRDLLDTMTAVVLSAQDVNEVADQATAARAAKPPDQAPAAN